MKHVDFNKKTQSVSKNNFVPSFDDISLSVPRVAISKNGLIIKTVTELNE